MKTEIKQVDGLLTIKGTAFSENEKVLLKEFFQKEIPGYDHQLIFEFDEANSTFQAKYVPIITPMNLEREMVSYSGDLQGGLLEYYIEGPYSTLYISRAVNIEGTTPYRITDNLTGDELTSGTISNIYEVRPLLVEVLI